MALPFKTFLKEAPFLCSSDAHQNIGIATIIGKDSKHWKKVDIFNGVVGQRAFSGRVADDEDSIYIEAFYSADATVLYLVLHGVQNEVTLSRLFVDEKLKGKSFFEKLADAETRDLSLVHFIFLISHVVFVLEQGRYFDLSHIKSLMNVNTLRQSMLIDVVKLLEPIPNISPDWVANGRLAVPKLCFLFPNKCMRTDLSISKKREIAAKLERAWESQIQTDLRAARIAEIQSEKDQLAVFRDNVNGNPLCVATPPRIDARDPIVDITNKFFTNRITENNEHNDNDTVDYIRNTMRNVIRQYAKYPNFYLFPSLKEFVEVTSVLYDFVVHDSSNDEVRLRILAPELANALTLEVTHWEQAVALYRKTCFSRGGLFSKAEHEEELAKAIQSLSTAVTEQALPQAIEDVTSACTAFWQEHQRCEAVSMTGQLCRFGTHNGRIKHDSNFRAYSTCNCGARQTMRLDPFSLKKANYDFYQQFSCCSALEAFPFPTFQPLDNVKTAIEETYASPRPTLTSIVKESPPGSPSKVLDTADLSQSLDGDLSNDFEEDEIGGFDRFIDDDKLKEMFDDEPASRRPNRIRQKSDPEDESPTGSTTYLDTYDSKLKLERPSKVPYKTLVQHYKDQFIDYLPHSKAPAGLLPGFPSWALTCVGQSNRYSHSSGLRASHFKRGSNFLLPLTVHVDVNPAEWDEDMRRLNSRAEYSGRRYRKPMIQNAYDTESDGHEKVKFFVGLEYECTRGHRFMIEKPGFALAFDRRAIEKDEAAKLIASDTPILMPCPCKHSVGTSAQLMRLHIVTPKAPVVACVDLKVQPDSNADASEYYYPHTEPLELYSNRYYVIRFPYVYVGPDGPFRPPKCDKLSGRLHKDWLKIVQRRVSAEVLAKPNSGRR
uniref:Nonsense-mediated mRNA decay factor SMG8 n=1 Tax=Panagrellus redivivus TaxID=6233 RepID=A0A7E4VYZ1_PANRE